MVGSGLIAALGCTGIRRYGPKASDVRHPSQVCANTGDVWSASQTGRGALNRGGEAEVNSASKDQHSLQKFHENSKKFRRCRLCIVGINNARNTLLHPVRII